MKLIQISVFIVLFSSLCLATENFPHNSKIGQNPELSDYSFIDYFSNFGERRMDQPPYITYSNPMPEQFHGLNKYVSRPFSYELGRSFYNSPYTPNLINYSQYKQSNNDAYNFGISDPKQAKTAKRVSRGIKEINKVEKQVLDLIKKDMSEWKDRAFGKADFKISAMRKMNFDLKKNDSTRNNLANKVLLMDELIKAYEK